MDNVIDLYNLDWDIVKNLSEKSILKLQEIQGNYTKELDVYETI